MSIALRIKDCVDNHDKYVAMLAVMPDMELAKKLETVHLQMALAEQKKNTGSLELLEVWRMQIIEARIMKAENRIPDAPNEMQETIAGIETIVTLSEERKKLLKKLDAPGAELSPAEPSPESEDIKSNDSQLELPFTSG